MPTTNEPYRLDLTIEQARKVFLVGCRVWSPVPGEGWATVRAHTKHHGVKRIGHADPDGLTPGDWKVLVTFDDGSKGRIESRFAHVVPYDARVDGSLHKGDKVVMLSDPYADFKSGDGDVGKVFTVNRASEGHFISARDLGRAHMSRDGHGHLCFAVVKLGPTPFMSRISRRGISDHREPTQPSPWARTYPKKAATAPTTPRVAPSRAVAAPPAATRPLTTADTTAAWFGALKL